MAWRAGAEPFGLSAPSGPAAQALRFPGQYHDAETGLHYNMARYYAPWLGRYLQADPIGLGGGVNVYAYVDNNPLSFVDPLGLAVDSPNAALESAIARGDIAQLENLMEALSAQEQAVARNAIEKFSSRAGDWVAKRCRGSINHEFPSQFRDKTLKEILDQAKSGDSTAKKAWKLLNDNRFQK